MFADPVKILSSFGLRENMIVADLGAGTGFYSVAAARMVPNGKVYAVEVQKDFLEKIKVKIAEEHLGNVETLWGNVEKIGGTKIKDKIVDAVIASNVLFQIENRDKFIEEIKRILKPGGILLLIDWSAKSEVIGHIDTIVPKEKALEMFTSRGFVFTRDVDAGAQHYGMIFKRQ